MFLIGIMTVYFVYRIRPTRSVRFKRATVKLGFLWAGAAIGFFACMLIGLLLRVLALPVIGGPTYVLLLIVLVLVLPAIGAVFMYYVGKRRNFQPYNI